jgi:hypothetical protein
MRRRSVATAAVMAAALPLLALPAVPASAVPNPDEAVLTITPAETTVPAHVVITGSCPAIDGDVEFGSYYPDVTALTFAAAGIESVDVALDPGGEFVVPADLPGGLEPGLHDADTSCGGSESVTVLTTKPVHPLPPPTLQLDPLAAQHGGDVTATGACPVNTSTDESFTTQLLLDSETSLATTTFDPESGRLDPVSFSVPEGAPFGERVITTSCGGTRLLTVLEPVIGPVTTTTPGTATTAPGTTTAPRTGAASSTVASSTVAATTPTASTSPDNGLIAVPDLTGLTERQAFAALGDQLTLANPSGDEGQIRTQVPPPGTLVEPASAVTVVLADVPKPSSLPLLLVAALVGAMIGALLYSDRLRRRRRRERRWVDSQVRTDMRAQQAEVSAVPDRSEPGLDLRLEVRRDPARLQFQEAGNVHD